MSSISKYVIKINTHRLDILYYFIDTATAWYLLKQLPTGMFKGYFKERNLLKWIKDHRDVHGDTTVKEMKQMCLKRIKDHNGTYKRLQEVS